MKTIRLKASTPEALKNDLSTMFPEWAMEMDYCTDVEFQLHYIGEIEGETGFHADVLVPDDFETDFATMIDEPSSPFHMFM